MQRQKSLLMKRLKVPPPINQFNKNQALNSNQAKEVFALLHKYRPETKRGKLIRLKKQAAEQANDKTIIAKRPMHLQQGINKVVTQVTQKKAKLVVISHDVDPIEIVMFLPALVRRKTCTAVCLNDVDGADKVLLNKIIDSVKSQFNDRYDDIRKTWGGGALGRKAEALKAKNEKAKEVERKKAEKAGVITK